MRPDPCETADEMLGFAPRLCRTAWCQPARKLGLKLGLAALAFSLTACEGGDGPEYGSVRLKFRVGNGVDPDDLFGQTKALVISAPYNECVVKYYRGKGSSQLFVSPKGEEVEDEWKTRVCASSDPTDTGRGADKFLECDEDNVSFKQLVEEKYDVPRLEIRIVMSSRTEAKTLSEADIRVGPLPTEALTGCKTFFNFSKNSSTGIQGKDKNNITVWKVLSDDVGTETPTPTSARAYTVTVGPP